MAPKNKSNRKRRARKRYQKHITNTNTMPQSGNLDTGIDSIIEKFEDTLDLQMNLDRFVIDQSLIDDEYFILGEGSFGLVTLGTIRKPAGYKVRVALKGANKFEFLQMIRTEAEVMSNFDHVNVVKFVGVQEAPFKIVMEYMQHGDLLDALNRNVFPNVTDLREVLIQVASGMEYISQMNYIHRDLACRNVFVNFKKQCKIGDFGLCRYVGNTGGIFKMERRQFFNLYCAPEVLDTGKFTTKSDVWSMGLLIWELYISFSHEIPSFYKRVLLDIFVMTSKLTKPRPCPQVLFSYIEDVLLNGDYNKRPTFPEIKAYLCDYNTIMC